MGWYGSYNAADHLSQGVILFNFPLPELDSIKQPIDGDEAQIEFTPYDVIVLTQSCDLENKGVDRVYLCPLYTLEEHFQANPNRAAGNKSVRSEYEHLRQGHYVNKFILNGCASANAKHLKDKYLVVIFEKTVVVSLDYVESFLQRSRRKHFIALNSPYREALSQHYGRYFMRVGNPIDLPNKEEFDPKPFNATLD